MQINYPFTNLFWIFFAIFWLTSCDDNKECTDPLNVDCPNYDPCLTYPASFAEFKIIDSLELFSPFTDMNQGLESDSILTYKDIWFKATHDCDSYEWQIGTDPKVFDRKEFSLYFDVAGEIPVRLITTRKPDKTCSLNDDGRDTFYKKFVLVIPSQNIPIFGKYKGYHIDTPNQEYTITVESPYPEWAKAGVYGLPNDCNNTVASPMSYGYKYFVVTDEYIECLEVKGVGRLNNDNKTLNVDFSYITNLNTKERISKNFIGVKQ
jgi:hypothetical protein